MVEFMKSKITMIAVLVVLLIGSGVKAATRTVDTIADNAGLTACTVAENDCSLRGAISGSASGDTVDFDSTIFAAAQTITLVGTSNPIIISRTLTIIGTNADKLTVSGNNANLVFDVRNFTVSLSRMTITGGNGTQFLNGTSAPGGGILNFGTTTISDCVITGNQSATTGSYGGGIYNNGGTLTLIGTTVSNNVARSGGFGNGGGISSQIGTVIVTNSTFSGNRVNSVAGESGGGIHIFSGNLIVTNSTISNNTVNTIIRSAGGITIGSGTATIRNSIIAANVSNGTLPDVFGSFTLTDGGNNVIGNIGTAMGFAQTGDQTGTGGSPLDPKIAALTINGGKTPTHALLPGSPAANMGNNCVLTNVCMLPVSTGSLVFDQRGAGFSRNVGGTVDIGAFELLAPTAANATIVGKILTSEGRSLRNVQVILTDSNGNSRTAMSNHFGYFRLTEVEAGQTYIVSVRSKRYQFTPQVLTINEDITELILTANE
jgi:Carboxypeptidase regulatory-like domain